MSTTSTQERLTGLTLDERWYELNFDLRLSSRYHTERRRFFRRLHTVVAGLSALFGSATVAVLLTDMPGGKQVAVVLSLMVAIGAATDAVIGFSRKAEDYGDLARRFIELERRFLLSEPSEVTYLELLSERRLIEADEPPALPALVTRCHRELARHDGHKDGDAGMPAAQGFVKRNLAQVLPLA